MKPGIEWLLRGTCEALSAAIDDAARLSAGLKSVSLDRLYIGRSLITLDHGGLVQSSYSNVPIEEIPQRSGRYAWIQSVPSAVADGCAACLDPRASTSYPSATADGTDCIQVPILLIMIR